MVSNYNYDMVLGLNLPRRRCLYILIPAPDIKILTDRITFLLPLGRSPFKETKKRTSLKLNLTYIDLVILQGSYKLWSSVKTNKKNMS